MIRRFVLALALIPCLVSVGMAQKTLNMSNILKKNYIDSIRVVIVGEQSNSIHRKQYLNSDTVYFKIIKIKKSGLTRIDTLPVHNLKLKSFSLTGALYTKNTKIGDHIDAEYRINDLFITGTPKQRLFNEFYATYGLTIINCDIIDEEGKTYKLEDRKIDLKISDGE